MLVLSREIEEKIMIGEGAEIQVEVLGINKGQVKIGITAPQQIPVHREEIYQRIQKEKRDARLSK